MKEVLKIEVEKIGSVSDGYYTFDELYEHRINLYIALCRNIVMVKEEIQGVLEKSVWRSRKHSDGDSWSGWFIMGIGRKVCEQITYHLPLSKWEETSFAETLDKAPEFDGHTPADVLERLKNL